MRKKIVCILCGMLLITMATIPLVSSKNTENKLVNTMPSMVDQQQPNNPEIHWLPANQPNWQKFIHHGKVLEKVELHFGCWYGGSQDITLSIWDTFGGPAITSVTYQASAFPLDVQAWFVFDFPDVNIPPLQPYWIVVEFGPGSEYAWSGSHNDPYPQGDSSHPDWDWDYAFKTIVDVVSHQGSPQVLDQNQRKCEDCRFLPNYGWQQFVPKANKLYYVDVNVGHFFGGSPDIKLSIEQPLGNMLTTVSLPVTQIPDHYCDWTRFDFPDIQTTPNTVYYIVLEYDPGGEYAWCGAWGNPYPQGTSDYDPDWDYTFMTYVDQVSHNNKVKENHPIVFQIFYNLMERFPILERLLIF
jgi:hypothetical protein